MTVLAERWVADGEGLLTRRGRTSRGATAGLDDGWTILHEVDMADIALGTMTAAKFRTYWGLTGSYNVGTDNAALFSCVEESGFGRCLQWTAVPGSRSGGLSAFPPLPGGVYADSIMMEYDAWYVGVTEGSPWVWGAGEGGKLPGFGGRTSDVGVIRSGNAPTGGSATPRGMSHRFMDIADSVGGDLATNDELIAYDYLPSQGTEFPPNDHLSPAYSIAQAPMRLRAEYHMNSVASPGVGNADGERRCYVAPAGTTVTEAHLRFEETGMNDLRLYDNSHFDQQVFSVFRGGNTDSWAPDAAYRVLLANLRIGIQNQQGTVALP